jgi:hypothetical protein
MATYDEWNRALVDFFASRATQGSAVYLAVDEEALVAAGRGLTLTSAAANNKSGEAASDDLPGGDGRPSTGDSLVEDFCQAIRRRAVQEPGTVVLKGLQTRDRAGYPQGVAFLCAMVLAATRMGDDGDISETNYFRRLHEVLGLRQLPSRGPRPAGLEAGAFAEEPLWKAWNRWLQEKGFLVSARSGEGPRKYIAYPLSQALIRRADKDRLRRLFRDKQWSAEWDADTLLAHVRREAGSLTQHLQDVLATDEVRLAAVSEALYEEYESWREAPHLIGAAAGYRGRSILMSGLYRQENPVTGQVRYYLYPRQLRGQDVEGRSVTLGNHVHQLVTERPGWLMPIGPIGPAELDAGLRLPIDPAVETTMLVLPTRDFWVLVPDRENPDSDVYATWGSPPLARPFVILCHRGLLGDLTRLREERLIEWRNDPQDVATSDWVEVRDCVVVSDAWQGVFTENLALYEALQPSQSMAIGVSGGLRVPGAAAWLEGYGPQVTVHRFVGGGDARVEVDVRIVRVTDERVVLDSPRFANEPFSIDWPGQGMYRVEASIGGQEATWPVRIAAWESLRATPPSDPEGPLVGEFQVCGALVRPREVSV